MPISALSSPPTFASIIGNASTEPALRTNKAEETAPETSPKPDRSANVILSKEAQAFAELASKGITAFTIHDGRRALQELVNGSGTPRRGQGGTISATDFDQVMRQLGATQSEGERLRKEFDSDGDGSITNDEMLGGLAGLLVASGNSPDAQLLLGLMDRSGDGDGVVQQDEFLDVETALVYAQKENANRGVA